LPFAFDGAAFAGLALLAAGALAGPIEGMALIDGAVCATFT